MLGKPRRGLNDVDLELVCAVTRMRQHSDPISRASIMQRADVLLDERLTMMRPDEIVAAKRAAKPKVTPRR